jgi:hypothetical protein
MFLLHCPVRNGCVSFYFLISQTRLPYSCDLFVLILVYSDTIVARVILPLFLDHISNVCNSHVPFALSR